MTDYYWAPEARTKHLYIPGASGYGKTTLMANLAIEDICETDQPVIVIDPKGGHEGLVERVLPFIPRSRLDDVVYISLKEPQPIDLLSFNTHEERSLITADIIAILQRFSYGSWGPAMQGTLRKLIPTLLDAADATFLDIAAFLEIERRRNEILAQVSPERREYWLENKPSKSDAGPISSRIANFAERPLRTFVDTKRNEGLNIADVIAHNKILLLDTSPASNDDGTILGALIMSRIQQAVFRRSSTQRCCQIYVDEFHNFITSAFNVMLSQARSFNVSLCLANQHPKQIADIWDDIVGCVSSYVIFRMDGTHAMLLRSKIKDPEPPGGTRKTRRMIEVELDQARKREEHLLTMVNDLIIAGSRFEEAQHQMWQATGERRQLEKQMAEVIELSYEAPPSFIDDIPSLPIGEAIFISADGTTERIKTPRLPNAPTPNFAAHIKSTDAQSGTKRTVDSTPSNTGTNPHNEGNAKKEDDISPSGAV